MKKTSSRIAKIFLLTAAIYFLGMAYSPLYAADKWSDYFQKGEAALSAQNPSAAVSSFRQALVLVKKQSKNPKDLLNCKLKLARSLTLVNQAGEARKLLQGIKKSNAILMELGSIEEAAGNHEGAMVYYNKAVADSEKNYGPYSPQAGYSLHSLGRTQARVGKNNEALKSLKRAITILSRNPNREADEQLKTIKNTYGDLLYGEDESDQTLINDFEKDVLKEKAPSKSPSTSPSGSMWQQQINKELQSSRSVESTLNETVAERALRMPASDATLAPAYRVVQNTITAQNRYGMGESQYQRMIATDIDALGPNHPSVANDLSGLAQVYIAKQKYSEARPLLERALSVYTAAYGNGNVLTINTKSSLAYVESQLKNYDAASRLYREALSGAQESLGSYSIETANILNSMAHLNFQLGKLEVARSYYEWAIPSTTRATGTNSPLLAACLKDYAQVLRQLDKVSDAEVYESKANRILSGLTQH